MGDRASLDALIAELERLPRAHRRQVLAALAPVEREAIQQLLDGDGAEVPHLAEGRFETCLSPWLATRLKDAEAGKGTMTAATRHALLEAARAASNGSRASARPKLAQRSLLQVVFGALRPRKAIV